MKQAKKLKVFGLMTMLIKYGVHGEAPARMMTRAEGLYLMEK